MRQSQVINIVQESLKGEGVALDRRAVQLTVTTFLAAIAQTLRGGHTVSLRGFGTFYVHSYRGRQGTKPHAAAEQPKFRAGRSLKHVLNT